MNRFDPQSAAEARKLNEHLHRLRHNLKVAEEEAQNNSQKDSYEIYLETTLENAQRKLDKELEMLKEEYERKVRRSQEAFDKTKVHCETQIKGLQEKKVNTPRIRKLKAEIKISEEELKHKCELAYGPSFAVSTPTPKSEGVSTPVETPAAPKKKRTPKVVEDRPTPVIEETPIATLNWDIHTFATQMEKANPDYIKAAIEGAGDPIGFKNKYKYSIDDMMEYRARLFPSNDD